MARRLTLAFNACGVLICLYLGRHYFRAVPGPQGLQLEAADLKPVTRLTAGELIRKSSASYRALKSYGVSSASVEIVNGKQRLLGAARLSYVRPDRLRIEGTSNRYGDGRPFKLISDGRSFGREPRDPSDKIYGTDDQTLPIQFAHFDFEIGAAVRTALNELMGFHGAPLRPRKEPYALDGEGALYGRDVYQLSWDMPDLWHPREILCRRTVWLDAKDSRITQERTAWRDGRVELIRYSEESVDAGFPETLFDVAEIKDGVVGVAAR